MKIITYTQATYGTYKLVLHTFPYAYISEPIIGYISDAKDEIQMLQNWNIKDILCLHDWKKV